MPRRGVDDVGGKRGSLHSLRTRPTRVEFSRAWDPAPLLVVGGESWREATRLGVSVAAGTLGGTPWVAVGSVSCDGAGVDAGCVYPLALPP